MYAINTNLTTSGNSVAVRLPKQLLLMSDIIGRVKLEASNGEIIISRADNAREGWEGQIKALVASAGDPTKEFQDLHASDPDGFDELPWDE